MDPLLPSKPFRGFPESLSRDFYGQNRSIEEVVLSPVRQEPWVRKKGYFFTIIADMVSFCPIVQSRRNSEYCTGIYGPGLLYEKP
jgi:hypothetical protein